MKESEFNIKKRKHSVDISVKWHKSGKECSHGMKFRGLDINNKNQVDRAKQEVYGVVLKINKRLI